ncbi:MAG TPA: fluoride efflux transporter CrcB [Pseudonocardiaceae bacterium]|nr:fluoride efflux transporter CrcB [Pseudonocardiaceae bacterium]
MTVLLVFAGAIIGAPLRYLADRTVQAKHDSLFPWGTLAVNVSGCLVLGILAGLGTGLPSPLLALLGTGFCGALTTYSTFSFETMRLWEQHARFYAVANVAISLVAGLGAVLLGYTFTTV